MSAEERDERRGWILEAQESLSLAMHALSDGLGAAIEGNAGNAVLMRWRALEVAAAELAPLVAELRELPSVEEREDMARYLRVKA